jgi:hypothetical protein
MDITILTSFFGWCSLLNGLLLVLWTVIFMAAPDLVYRIQSRWFPIPQETFNVVFYLFIGVFKLLFLFFNLVPYVVLLIIQ